MINIMKCIDPSFKKDPLVWSRGAKQHVRNVVNACIKANDLPTLRTYVYASSVVGNDWTLTPFNTTHNGYTVPGSRIMDSYASEDDMMHTMGLAVKSKNKDIIKEVYGWFKTEAPTGIRGILIMRLKPVTSLFCFKSSNYGEIARMD